MQPFKRLAVWEKAHELTLRIYRASEGSAMHRYPGLSAQMRRAAAAIPTNIAEGAGHASQAQFNRFLEISLASASELEYQLLLAQDLGLIPPREYAQLEARVGEVRAMMLGLRKRIATRQRADRPSSSKKS
jgi:four helix bundle protein